jgi:Phosphotransferase enzyme family
MPPFDQTERETFRLIVVRRNGSELLLCSDDSRFALPSVQILPHERCALQLTNEARRCIGMQVCCLFIPQITAPNANESRKCYAVMEALDDDGQPLTGCHWIRRTGHSSHGQYPSSDADAISQSLRELDLNPTTAGAGPFAKAGWVRELLAWTQNRLDAAGLRLNGNFQQFNASPNFSLIRLETNGTAVWFKATGEPNAHELGVTLRLAQLFPLSLPPILGVHQLWNGWLSEELSDTTLDQFTELSVWEGAAEQLAELQVVSIDRNAALIDARCKDLRVSGLVDFVPAFLERMAYLMSLQEKRSPAPLTASELDFLGTRLLNSLLLLQHLGFPDTLGHMDFNPGNIVVSGSRCVFLDWAEACVTNPLFTLEYLLEHARRCLPQETEAPVRIATAYLRPWRTLFSLDDLARALGVSPLPAVFVCALANTGWQSPDLAGNSGKAAYLRSLTRRMHREATRIDEAESSVTQSSCLM